MNSYDIEDAFRRIEEELIASAMRNLARHQAEEEDMGYRWTQWQVEQLRLLEEYKRNNAAKFKKQFAEINGSIDGLITAARESGNAEAEEQILRAIRRGAKLQRRPEPLTGGFFNLNTRKLEALIEATVNDFDKAEHAMLRRANDQYRSIIYSAQVYANTGAGTYQQAVDMAAKDFLSAGINCIEYSNGARHTMHDYASMVIRTATKRAKFVGEGEKRKEWGITTVIVNKRGNPCPKCLPFVGKIFIDDIWSGGKSTDGNYPLLSSAVEAGLYHPNCKDSHHTYFPGITSADDQKLTKKDVREIEKTSKEEAEAQYVDRQVEKYDRLEKHSLDESNKKKYKVRRELWEKHKINRNNPNAVSKKDAEVIEYYVSGDGMYINQFLRGIWFDGEKYKKVNPKDILSEEDLRYISDLDKAIDRTISDDTLWRSVDASTIFGDMDVDKYYELRRAIKEGKVPDGVIGKTIKEPGYMSTTASETVAKDFGDFTGSDKPVVIKFENAKGAKGRDVSPVGDKYAYVESEKQYERLLARDTEYELKGVAFEGDNIVVRAELKKGIAENLDSDIIPSFTLLNQKILASP